MATSRRVLSNEHLLAEAERWFHTHGGLDMQGLAEQLAVSRATLYRVAGSRERLLGEVLWRQGSQAMARGARTATGTGAERLVSLARQFNEGLVTYAPMRRFLQGDPVTAFRVLFMAEARVHARFVQLWRELFVEAEQAGELELPFDVDELAYVFVRLGESMLYADLLSGLEPNVELCARMQLVLLTAGAQPSGALRGGAPSGLPPTTPA